MRHLLLPFLTMILLLGLAAQEADAIPAFARKYDMSCNVCHAPVPKLKSYGEAFAANGYQLPDKEPARFTRETGDDKLYLMREVPLAFRIDGSARLQSKDDPKADMEWPFIVKVLSGGQIAKDISYYMYFLFSEAGEVAGVEDAFLHFNNVGSAPFDITVGQFQVADPIFKRELRPMYEDYEIYKVRPGLSKADLTYDRGLILNYTLPTETDLFVSVLNGNGIGPASGDAFDSDPYKNVFGRVAHPLSPSVRLGTLGYLGKEEHLGVINDLYMLGADATVGSDNLEFAAQYLYRHDKNPFFLSGGEGVVKSYGGFAQLMYAPEGDKSDWYLFFLYNNVFSDIDALKYRGVAGNVSYILARNLKLTAELGYDIEHEKQKMTIGFVTAF